jgi:hypothetical protein
VSAEALDKHYSKPISPFLPRTRGLLRIGNAFSALPEAGVVSSEEHWMWVGRRIFTGGAAFDGVTTINGVAHVNGELSRPRRYGEGAKSLAFLKPFGVLSKHRPRRPRRRWLRGRSASQMSPQGINNFNGPNSLDHDTRLDLAHDRMSKEGLAHSDTGDTFTGKSTARPTKSDARPRTPRAGNLSCMIALP